MMPVSLLREMWRLNRQQWVAEEKLRDVQFVKARKQIARAWRYSPFYRERFKSVGFHPNDFRTLDDLRLLPVVTRAELTDAGEAAYCEDKSKSSHVWLKTSGSSGSPLSLPFTRADKARRALKELRALFANQFSFGDRMMILVEPRCLVDKQGWMQKLGFLRRDYVSIFAEDSRQLEMIRSMRPQVIYGYTSTLRILADAIQSNNVPITAPKILVSSAELLDSGTRRVLKSAFGVEPVDFYGSMEFGWIAWQCPERRGYHVNSDCLIVESLQDGGPAQPGQEGELVVTNLHSDAAPLIRYASGDAGVLGHDKCSCGRSLPLLTSISGRLVDFLVRPDGRKLSPYVVTCAIEDVPGVQQFQVIQTDSDDVTVRLMASANGSIKEQVRNAVASAMGAGTRIIVEQASSLSLEPNGKFKVVKSMIRPADSALRKAG